MNRASAHEDNARLGTLQGIFEKRDSRRDISQFEVLNTRGTTETYKRDKAQW